MLYAKRRSRRARKVRRPAKRSGKLVPWYNAKYTPVDMAAAALKGVWYLKGLVNSEKYKFDVVNQQVSPLNTGSMTVLSAIAQGDGDGNRTGNSVFARSINIKGYAQRNTSGNAQQLVRISLLIDTQQIADTAPAFSDVYEGTDVNSHLNSDTVGRFKILYNNTFVLDSVNVPLRKFEINIPMRHHIRFNGSATTDLQKGGIYIAMVSSQATANAPTVFFDSRLSYHDN